MQNFYDKKKEIFYQYQKPYLNMDIYKIGDEYDYFNKRKVSFINYQNKDLKKDVTAYPFYMFSAIIIQKIQKNLVSLNFVTCKIFYFINILLLLFFNN
jgi:hypothetical protein